MAHFLNLGRFDHPRCIGKPWHLHGLTEINPCDMR